MLFVLFLHFGIHGFPHCGLINIIISVAWTLEMEVCMGERGFLECKTYNAKTGIALSKLGQNSRIKFLGHFLLLRIF